MAETLNVQMRELRGKRNAKRLRQTGAVPAVLYGHGEQNLSLAIQSAEIAAVVRHGSRVVDLGGALKEKALIKHLQWDVYGTEVLHVDFSRVSEHERVEVRVPLKLRGQAPGVKEGGVIELLVHEVEIDCEAVSIPDHLEINVNELHIDGSLTADKIKLPEGVKLLTDPETIVVHCTPPAAEEEAEAGVGEGAEPEIIGRKPEDEEGEE
jgi:large subunit ribosomal protein L25